MFFIQVLQVDFLADFQFTQVYTGLLFLPPDEVPSSGRLGQSAHSAHSRLSIWPVLTCAAPFVHPMSSAKARGSPAEVST